PPRRHGAAGRCAPPGAARLEDARDRLRTGTGDSHDHPLGRCGDGVLQHRHPEQRDLCRRPVGDARGRTCDALPGLGTPARAGAPGPCGVERVHGWARVWGEVTDEQGGRAVARLKGPEGYTFTVETALAVVARALKKETPVGFQTPSLAFGADFVLAVPGVE